jgi:hypothetical protein
MIRGSAKFDSIAVGEVTCSFLGPTIHLEAKAAFVGSKSGDTHGWTTNSQWTPVVMEKLRELRALMEIELGQIHFDGAELVTAPIGAAPQGASPGGLGERFGGAQV